MSALNVYFLAAVVAIVGGAFAVIQYVSSQHRKAIERVVAEVLEIKLDNEVKSLVEDAVQLGVGPIDTRLSVIETKMDVFWKSVAIDVAKILHHPESSRQYLDDLLEKFMAGTITKQEARDLKLELEKIRDWEPGQPTDFMIYQGEQVAAAILLHTMDHVTKEK